MAERVATTEAVVRTVKEDVAEIKSDVKSLVAWKNEERGARRQRNALLSIASVAVPVLVTAALKVMGV